MKALIVVGLLLLVLYVASGTPSPTTAPKEQVPADNSIAATASPHVISPAMTGGLGKNFSGQNVTSRLANFGFTTTRLAVPRASVPMGVKIS